MENKKIRLKEFRHMAGKVLNVSWKASLSLIGILILAAGFFLVREQYGDHYGKNAHWADFRLSRNICVHNFGRGSVRVYDMKAGKYVTPELKWVSGTPQRDSLTVFCDMDDMRGFINVNTGEIVIGGRYEHAWVFSEGLAAVVEPGGKMGFIGRTAEYVIAPELEYMSDHDYVFKHDVCCIENQKGEQGLMSRDGTWVLPQEYCHIDYVPEADMFIPMKDGRKGLVRNGSFEWLCPMEYEDIYWTDAPSGEGFILYKDFCKKHVTADGTIIDPFVIDETAELKYMTEYHPDCSDEYAISDRVTAFRVYGRWGVMDKHSGDIVVPAMYGEAGMVSEGIIKCSLGEYSSSNYVLFDLKGKKIQ